MPRSWAAWMSGRQLWKHCEAAADVKAADDDLHARGQEGPAQIHGARELIGLDACEQDESGSTPLVELPDDAARGHDGVEFVVGLNLEFDVIAERVSRANVDGECDDGS